MKRLIELLDRSIMGIILTVLIVTMLGVVLYPRILRTVPSGEVGVVWRRFDGGTDTQVVLGEGTHLMWPWDRVYVYESRVRQMQTEMKVLTTDGISVDVTAVVRFRIDPPDAGRLHKYVGPDFVNRLIMPPIIGRIRAVLGPQKPEQIYSTLKNILDVELEIANYARARIESQVRMFDSDASAIDIIDVLLTQVKLPDYVNAAIERKAEQEQVAQEYNFRVAREKLEADRKAIEAEGIKRFQQEVGSSLTEQLLRWRGIEASEKLATSPNAKTLLFGAPQTGLPLVLGPAEGFGQQPPATATTNTQPAANNPLGPPPPPPPQR